MNSTLSLIKKDKLIKKFCMYGFLKNLRFFEPFLVIYLLSMNLSFLLIGVLYSIREITNYIFEVPSGIFADHYGKKTEMSFCFILYIISFILFFIGGEFYVLAAAMVFFGLGEAFRSGTHKAIIFSYLEEKDWFMHKSFVYGRTRSFSLVGSSLSAFLSILFVLNLSNLRGLFLICIIPYLLDFFLILSYPNWLNEKQETSHSMKKFFANGITQIRDIAKNRYLLKIVASGALFDGIFKSIKDYIQPILQSMLLVASITIIEGLNTEDNLTVALAVIYGVIYLASSYASRNVYKLTKFKEPTQLINVYFDILAVGFLLIALFMKLNMIYVIVLLYFLFYVLKDSRRPLFIDVIGDVMEKKQRVTVLSIESQFRALFMVVFAPIFGYIADRFSIEALFLVLGVMLIVISRVVHIEKKA